MAGDKPGGRSRGRSALLGGLAVLALVLLIGGPIWATAQSGYWSRFPNLAEKHEPWAASTHAEAGCESCHVPPGVLAQVGYRTRMIGEFYVSLVNRNRVPGVFAEPTNEACLVCHADLRSVSPAGDLQIPHRAHVNILKMDCVECHDYLVHEKNPSGAHTPTMEGCMTCHNGDTARDDCTACHTEKAAPDTHASEDWLVVHGEAAASPDCDSCHEWTENWCVDCHIRRPASHTADWRALHGEQVTKHRSCEACHEGAFCIRCHGEVPSLNLDPTLQVVE